MSVHAAVWWTVLVLFMGLLIASGVPLVRAYRTLKRAADRLGDAGRPVFAAGDAAARDIARLEAALSQLPDLAARARAALDIIRAGPLPPGLRTAFARMRAEVASFRAYRSGRV